MFYSTNMTKKPILRSKYLQLRFYVGHDTGNVNKAKNQLVVQRPCKSRKVQALSLNIYKVHLRLVGDLKTNKNIPQLYLVVNGQPPRLAQCQHTPAAGSKGIKTTRRQNNSSTHFFETTRRQILRQLVDIL